MGNWGKVYWGAEIICYGDFGSWNIVWRGTLAYLRTVTEVAPQMVPVALSTARHSRVDS